MKKLLYVLSFMVLVSCGQHKKEIARMQAKQDSITQVAIQKDNTIREFIGEMNEIQMDKPNEFWKASRYLVVVVE